MASIASRESAAETGGGILNYGKYSGPESEEVRGNLSRVGDHELWQVVGR